MGAVGGGGGGNGRGSGVQRRRRLRRAAVGLAAGAAATARPGLAATATGRRDGEGRAKGRQVLRQLLGAAPVPAKGGDETTASREGESHGDEGVLSAAWRAWGGEEV